MRHIGKLPFIVLFGIILSVPLTMNYYFLKFLLSLLSFFLLHWAYTWHELFYAWITCLGFGLIFGMYVQSKRMAAASIQQDKADTPFIRITIFNPDLLNKTDKVKVMVDADWITSAAINQHSTVDIPLDHSPSPETLQLHFVDQKGNIHYDIHTV